MKQHRVFIAGLTLLTSAVGVTSGQAVTVVLQQATATFSQTLDDPNVFLIGKAIDGSVDTTSGWAIAQNDGTTTNAETAVFETSTDVGFAGGSVITFTISQLYGLANQHTVGRFRISVTTDNRNLFADGLASNGDVTANWIILDPSTAVAANGTTLTKQGDSSVLASGTSPNADTYTITAPTSLTGITGVRLEVLADPSLPSSGPGRATNGNFVLAEFQMSIVPEPSSALLLLPGAALCLRRRTSRG